MTRGSDGVPCDIGLEVVNAVPHGPLTIGSDEVLCGEQLLE